MKHYTAITLAAIAVLLSSCSNPISFGSDFESGVDFGSFQNYAWHAPNEYNQISNNYIADDIVDGRIRGQVDEELQSKGFVKVDNAANADFLVNYSIITRDKVDINTYNVYSGYSTGWGGAGRYGYYGYPYRYYGVGGIPVAGATETRVTEYTQGTFVLDIISAPDDKLAWRGTAEGRMSRSQLTPQEREERIVEVVGGVLTDFPPE